MKPKEAMSIDIRIKNVPADLRDKLHARADSRGESLSDHILTELDEVVMNPVPEQWIRRSKAGQKPVRRGCVSNKLILDAIRADRP